MIYNLRFTIYKTGCLFITTPAYHACDARRIIQSEHLPYLFRLRDEGIVALSIPVFDDTDVTAIAVYTATGKDEVRQLTGGRSGST